ncbi:MAG: ABC transporter ATP-binding protein, partial [Hyphomicrobiales bacterium]
LPMGPPRRRHRSLAADRHFRALRNGDALRRHSRLLPARAALRRRDLGRGMHPAISVENLAKKYRIGPGAEHRTLAEALSALARRVVTGPSDLPLRKEFWALRGVSFEVAPGETIGIVGANGAGKSTLLKILSRITEPTEGLVRYTGRIGSLLEVGTGFHPELTGRDNIYLCGAILGMRRGEIALQFDRIVDFAEIGEFIDIPVKRYSSGMYMRLAFAVAAHLDTDVLLVDEVLAVGDMKFQRKCLERMGEAARDGRTVVFVSHNLLAIQSLCTRALWIDHGLVAAEGRTGDVLAAYMREGAPSGTAHRTWGEAAADAPTGEGVRLRRAAVLPLDGDPAKPLDIGRGFALEVDYASTREDALLGGAVALYNQDGALVFHAGPTVPPQPCAPGCYRDRCVVPGDLLNDGTYRVTFELRDGDRLLLTARDLLGFEVLDSVDGRFGWYGKWEGVIRPRLEWTSERIA